METSYITSIKQFQDFCMENRGRLAGINGDCKRCPKRKRCLSLCKEQNIDSALHMEANESRFPGLFRLFQSRPSLFWVVPSVVYAKAYGTYRDDLPCQFCNVDYILEHMDEIREAFDILTDEKSRLTFLNVLMYRMTIEPDYILRAYDSEPQYMIEPFRNLGENEVFVDCGAFRGDTFEQYCRYNHSPKEAYLFEPDSENRRVLEAVCKNEGGATEFHIIGKGVSRKSGKMYFISGQEMGCHLSDDNVEGSISIDVTSLDDAIEEKVTFIKMDIEGSEQDALYGAKRLILKNYPKLAVCTYHSVKDMWEIPILMKKEFPEYTHFIMGHHTKLFFETVLYAYK